jgi:hypothetical protein
VKHGLAQRVADWPFSSIHRYVAQGLLPDDWAGDAKELSGSFKTKMVGFRALAVKTKGAANTIDDLTRFVSRDGPSRVDGSVANMHPTFDLLKPAFVE